MEDEAAMRRLKDCVSTEARNKIAAEIFQSYRERLRLMVDLRLDPHLRVRIDPSDVLQDAFVDLLCRLDEYLSDTPMPFFLWLRRITGQRLVSLERLHLGAMGRDARRDVSLGASWPGATSVVLAERLLAENLSPSKAAMREETKGSLKRALDKMDPLDREVVVLRHFEGLTNREVATTLGLGESSASKRYFRAVE